VLYHRLTCSLEVDAGSLLARVSRELDVARLPVLISHERPLECDSLTNAGKSEDNGTNLEMSVTTQANSQPRRPPSIHLFDLPRFDRRR
jgi:hypothetical protein